MLFLCLMMLSLGLSAQNTGNGTALKTSYDDLQADLKAYIIKRTPSLTQDQQERFFPVYEELQSRLQDIEEQSWSLLEKGRKLGLKEGEYQAILDGYYKLMTTRSTLEETFKEKFLEIVTPEQLYKILLLEKTYRVQLLRDKASLR